MERTLHGGVGVCTVLDGANDDDDGGVRADERVTSFLLLSF